MTNLDFTLVGFAYYYKSIVWTDVFVFFAARQTGNVI